MDQGRHYANDTRFGTAPRPRDQADVTVAEKVLRLARKSQAAGTEDEVKRTGQAALDLVYHVAAALRENEARAEAMLRRAIDEVKAADARIKALEARALQAETRAKEAEKWLVRLHDAIEDKLTDWRGGDSGQRTNLAA